MPFFDTLQRVQFNFLSLIGKRWLMTAFTVEQWEFVISELTRVCQPGGFIEFGE